MTPGGRHSLAAFQSRDDARIKDSKQKPPSISKREGTRRGKERNINGISESKRKGPHTIVVRLALMMTMQEADETEEARGSELEVEDEDTTEETLGETYIPNIIIRSTVNPRLSEPHLSEPSIIRNVNFKSRDPIF